MAIALAEADSGTVSDHTAVQLVLEEIGYGLIGGVIAGVLGALALRLAARRGMIDPHWTQILTAAAALLAAGVATKGGEFFNAVTFIVFGAVILGPNLDEITWQLIAYALLSLTVVRMVPVALALLGTGARRPTVGFLGWFGLRGLASIVFAIILLDEADLPHLRTLLLAITFTIAISVYAHGVTAGPLTKRYVR